MSEKCPYNPRRAKKSPPKPKLPNAKIVISSKSFKIIKIKLLKNQNRSFFKPDLMEPFSSLHQQTILCKLALKDDFFDISKFCLPTIIRKFLVACIKDNKLRCMATFIALPNLLLRCMAFLVACIKDNKLRCMATFIVLPNLLF